MRRNLSAEFTRAAAFSAVVGLDFVADGYFFNRSCCLIVPRRRTTGEFDVFVADESGLEGKTDLRSIARRGLLAPTGSTGTAFRGPVTRTGAVTPSSDDRGLRRELVVELLDERRVRSCSDVCLNRRSQWRNSSERGVVFTVEEDWKEQEEDQQCSMFERLLSLSDSVRLSALNEETIVRAASSIGTYSPPSVGSRNNPLVFAR